VSTSLVSEPGTALPAPATIRLVRASLLVLFTYIFLANAWIGDDAQIAFRAAWNLVHGYGFTFNPDERVQAFTDPLWTLLVAGAHVLTGEFFFTATALSWALNVAAGVVLLRRATGVAGAALAVGWLLSSKALVDYTSSGLEYPLAYLLIALFYTRYLRAAIDRAPSYRELRYYTLVAALAFVTRVDMAVLFVVPLAEMAVRALRERGRHALKPLLIGASPAIAWLVFATFYYGFPLPNTYYAKVANGVPSWLQHQQGWAYVFNSLRFDPITLTTIALAAMVAVRTPGAARRAALSAVLYVAYTVSVGGDFMSGRFFAMPFLIAVMTVAFDVERALLPWLGSALVLYNLIVPIVPIKTTSTYDGAWPWRTQNGIKDERGHTHQASNVLSFAPFRTLPDTPFAREGRSFAASERHASVYCCIGAYGLQAGPTKFVIDENALSDPLLARLPVSPRLYFDFWTSHYFRDLPEGYIESVERNENLLADPLLREYYDKLRNVTRGPLFRSSRLTDIVALNVRYRRLHEEYEKRRPIALSIPANHDRFLTDVGLRDAAGLRSTGQPGYLQTGPGIPVKRGFYRARWIATVTDAPDGTVGFVEAWKDGERLDRQPVRLAGHEPHQRIAQLDFSLPEGARSLEYRFYVNAGVRVAIERVELYSGPAIPADN